MANRNVFSCKIEHATFIHPATRPGAPVQYVVKLEKFVRVTLRPDSFIRIISLFRAANARKYVTNKK